ncbi:MAG: hypothetical protein QM778_20880 [Myxococcales bacterium]
MHSGLLGQVQDGHTAFMPPSASSETSSSVATGASRSSQPPASAVFVREGAAWSELSPLGGGNYRVRLGGIFRPAWMATLGSGLAERRISIDTVHAKRGHDGSWVAELALVALEGASDPRGISYIGLAGERAQIYTGDYTLELDRYSLFESPDYGGTLLLEFEALDSLGLLGAMLSSLAALGLFPIEMHIETHAARAHDFLWLCGTGASRPSPEAKQALERMLRKSHAL